jgi:peptidoglycan/xylan/chitin deacetylase (PgdA/CDA1 family)
MLRSIATVLFAISLGTVAIAAEPTATILTYHVVESPSDTYFAIPRAEFRKQMNYLATTGYEVISLSTLVDYLEGRIDTIPENSVVITIDDGWRCTYDEFYPELKRLGFPFTVFVYPAFVNGGQYSVTWDQLREMASDGAEIESHTMSHAFLARSRHRMSAEAYGRWLRRELAESRKVIESHTGTPVRFLAYPYGDYNDRVVAETAAAGYVAALTSNFGHVRKGANLLRLNRVAIDRKTSFAQFRGYFGSTRMQLAETTPSPGSTFDPQAPVVSARIASFESLDPDSVGMAIIGLGQTPFSYDPRTGRISITLRDDLAAGLESAVVWGRDRKSGRRVEAAWDFRMSSSAPGRVAKNAPARAPRQGRAAPEALASGTARTAAARAAVAPAAAMPIAQRPR